MMYLDLVLNLALLIALSVLSGFISRRWPRTSRPGPWVQGFLFGSAAVIGMLKPLVLGPGLVFDGRSVMVSLCALFHGPIAGVIAALMPILCRIQLGGIGTFTGVLVILSSMAIGLLAHAHFQTRKATPDTRALLIFGFAVHLSMLALMLTLPREVAWLVIRNMALPILFIYPLATLLAGKVLSEQEFSAHHLRSLENSRKNLDITLRSIGDAVIATDTRGRITLMNPVAQALTGWTFQEALQKPLTDIFRVIHAHTRAPAEDPVKKVIRTGKVEGLSNHTLLIAKDGQELQIADSAAPIFQEDGVLTGVVLVFRDVSEEYRNLEKLKASEALLRMAGRMARLGGWSVDLATGKITWSDGVAIIHGMPPEYAPTLEEAFAFYAPEWREKIRKAYAACSREGLSYDEEMEILNAQGVRIWVRTIGEAIRDKVGVIIRVQGAFQDIDERKKTEIQIQKQDLLLREMGGIAQIGAWEFDPETGKGTWTDEVARIHGLPVDEATSVEKGLAFYTEESRRRIESAIQDVLSRQKPYDLELQMLSADGNRKWIRTIGHPVIREGRVVQVRGTFQDITRQKASEEALLASEEDYRRLFEEHAAIKFILDPETGAIIDANEAAVAYYGWSRESLRSMHIQDINLLSFEEIAREIEKVKARNRVHFEFQHRRADGSIRDVAVFSSRIRMKGKDYLHSIIHDISERKRLENQLLQSQKMEAIGKLAGGVAHDFNNMLSIILGHGELMEESLGSTHPAIRDVHEIQKAARRSAELTRQLLAFARRQTIAPKILDLNSTIEGMLRMLRRLIGEDIDLQWHPTEHLWPVRMDPSQVDQILANLTINAKDAISGIGRLTIETSNVSFDEAYCETQAEFLPGDYVMLAVSDDGCGMNRDTLSQIFEPFFTTKPQGAGTGLGLSMVYGIIRQNGGFIHVYSEPGKGSSFRIYIPREKKGLPAPPQTEKGPIPTGKEGVLVVEDEPALLKLTSRMLGHLGYKVFSAATPTEALDIAQAHGEDIHLLLTDVIMPEMNGRDLAHRLQLQHPHMRTLFMSGYTANVIAHHGVLKPGMHFIQKPFSMKNIADKIRETLSL